LDCGFEPPAKPDPLPPIERLAAAERFFAATAADVRHGGDRAYYNRAGDFIQMPDEALFTGTATMTRSEGYYATLGHEHIHRTGAEARLNRNFGKRFADDAYVAEELVAEIGSAFLCAELGISQDVRPDHAHYLAHWLQLLKSDSRATSPRAAEAVDYLKTLQAATAAEP
jgi:antirestriction protein ArdC